MLCIDCTEKCDIVIIEDKLEHYLVIPGGPKELPYYTLKPCPTVNTAQQECQEEVRKEREALKDACTVWYCMLLGKCICHKCAV